MPGLERSKLPVRVERWKSKAKPTLIAIERIIAAEGLTPYDTHTYSKGWSIGGHSHDRLEVRAVVTGKFEYSFGTKKFLLKPGDILFIPSRAGHSARSLAASKLVVAYKEEFVDAGGIAGY